MEDILKIADRSFNNRLFVGTGKFPDKRIIGDIIRACGCQVVTVALRRVDEKSADENILDYIPSDCTIMINTSGARNADEAIRIARLGKAMGCGNWIKIEVIPDNKYLLPDNIETLKATKALASEGFVPLAYMNPDLITARALVEAGAAAVMPLGSTIGSGRGFKTREMVRIMINEIDVPVIVDAGLGSPADAALCMESGCDAVLVNTAIAIANDPVMEAEAFALAVKAGRRHYVLNSTMASPGPAAQASSPLTGFLRD
ncbi:MAG: thiazole synthase [Candidatus Omnitrophica bacterium]|jgi:thiazole synthase|nr:thiazole synthase [Candidatus Omnitrophota bacterium]